MASILQPFRNILNPGKYQVPTGDLSIDFTHPLANGLLAAYIPNDSGDVTDLVGFGGTINRASGNKILVDGMTPDGPGIQETASTAGIVAPALTSTSPLLTSTSFTTFARGFIIGNSGANGNIFVVNYNVTQTAPFLVWGLICGTTGTTGNGFKPAWNSNGTLFLGTTSGAMTAGTMNSMGGTFVIGAASPVTTYLNGVAIGATVNFGAIAPINTVTSCVGIGDPVNQARSMNMAITAAYMWNRALSATEMAWLHQSPYEFIVPTEYELPILLAGAGPPAAQIYAFDQVGAHITRKITSLGY